MDFNWSNVGMVLAPLWTVATAVAGLWWFYRRRKDPDRLIWIIMFGLIVIVVVGDVVGMLVPAIHAASEAAEQNQ